jgi:hypothetical protein
MYGMVSYSIECEDYKVSLHTEEVVSADASRVFPLMKLQECPMKPQESRFKKSTPEVPQNVLEPSGYAEASMTYNLHPVKGSGLNSCQSELYLLCLFAS